MVLKEFNRRWNEDLKNNEVELNQYMADMAHTRQAPWRIHQPIRNREAVNSAGDVADMMAHVDRYQQLYGPQSARRLPAYRQDKHGRPVPVLGEALNPLLNSRFSDWGSDDEDEEPLPREKKRRSFCGLKGGGPDSSGKTRSIGDALMKRFGK